MNFGHILNTKGTESDFNSRLRKSQFSGILLKRNEGDLGFSPFEAEIRVSLGIQIDICLG